NDHSSQSSHTDVSPSEDVLSGPHCFVKHDPRLKVVVEQRGLAYIFLLMRSYEAFHGLSLVVQLIPAVGIIDFAAWGLGPLLRASRIHFLQAKSKEHQVMTSYIQPLLLWGGVVLIYRLLEQVILHSSTKPSCQATAFEFCSFIVYSFGICILLIERRMLRALKMIRQSKGGLPTPASLSVVTQSTRQLRIEQAGECLTQLTRQLEDQDNVTDPLARLRLQSSALRSGALLHNLGSLLASTVNLREASGREHSTTTALVAASDGGVLNGEAGVRNLSQPRGGPDVPVVPIRIYTLPWIRGGKIGELGGFGDRENVEGSIEGSVVHIQGVRTVIIRPSGAISSCGLGSEVKCSLGS
nr:hypothetical protein [Tanacetum cinerariifolium]